MGHEGQGAGGPEGQGDMRDRGHERQGDMRDRGQGGQGDKRGTRGHEGQGDREDRTETTDSMFIRDRTDSTHSSSQHMLLIAHLLSLNSQIRGGADWSSARPTSRCRRTESIVSLERGVCSCAELQIFSCYRG